MCRECWHILSPATIYARRQNMPQHGLFPLTGVVDGKHSDCVSHLLQVFSVDVTFCDFGSLVLHALFLAFYVFHGCRLLEVERDGNSGFGPPAHLALSWACDEALLRNVSEVQKARVVIGQGAEIAQWLAGAPDSWLKGRGFESLQERRENFLLQGRLSVLILISVSVPPPCYRSST